MTSPGPLGEEAARLVEAVQDWAARTFPPSAHPTDAPTCGWCPACQGLAVLRGDRPDVTDRITDAVTAAGSALSALAAALARPPEPAPEPEPTSTVHRIDLDEPDA